MVGFFRELKACASDFRAGGIQFPVCYLITDIAAVKKAVFCNVLIFIAQRRMFYSTEHGASKHLKAN